MRKGHTCDPSLARPNFLPSMTENFSGAHADSADFFRSGRSCFQSAPKRDVVRQVFFVSLTIAEFPGCAMSIHHGRRIRSVQSVCIAFYQMLSAV